MNTSISSIAAFQYAPSSKPVFGFVSAPTNAATNQRPRPKLSLNTTSQPRTLGRGSTGLRLDTLNVTSPTSQNTYRNVYESPISTPSLESDSGSASTPFPRIKPSITKNRAVAFAASTPTSTSVASSPTAAATIPLPVLPYEQPANLKSILRNRPGSSSSSGTRTRKKLIPRRLSTWAGPNTIPAATTPTQEKTIDGAVVDEAGRGESEGSLPSKRVCFQQPLCVDIETSVYVLRHSDLPSRSPSPSPIVMSAQDEDYDHDGFPQSQRPSSSSSSMSSLSSTNDDDDDSSANSSPDTPVAHPTNFRKREREWVWTLGPINRVGDKTCSSNAAGQFTMDDDNDVNDDDDDDVLHNDQHHQHGNDNDDDDDEKGPAPKKSMLDIDLMERA